MYSPFRGGFVQLCGEEAKEGFIMIFILVAAVDVGTTVTYPEG